MAGLHKQFWLRGTALILIWVSMQDIAFADYELSERGYGRYQMGADVHDVLTADELDTGFSSSTSQRMIYSFVVTAEGNATVYQPQVWYRTVMISAVNDVIVLISVTCEMPIAIDWEESSHDLFNQFSNGLQEYTRVTKWVTAAFPSSESFVGVDLGNPWASDTHDPSAVMFTCNNPWAVLSFNTYIYSPAIFGMIEFPPGSGLGHFLECKDLAGESKWSIVWN